MERKVNHSVDEANYDLSPELLSVLIQKGIHTESLLKATFHPTLENLVHWSELPEVSEFLSRLERFQQERRKILVWGHEDADGFTATAVLIKILQTLGFEPLYYVPSKRTEGHGLAEAGLRYAADQNVDVIITVDTGGSDVEGVEHAKSLGLEVIITDHHEIPSVLPDTLVINPKRHGGWYPYLAGVGVALKLAWAVADRFLGWSLSRLYSEMPELFVYTLIGTLADRVPLCCENLILRKAGEQALNEHPPHFVEVLSEKIGQSPPLDLLISLISSGERQGPRHTGVDLLLEESPEVLGSLIQRQLEGVQAYRETGERLLQQALSQIRKPRRYLLIDMKDIDPKFLGFIASRVKDQYNIPTIVLGRKGEEIVAEVRAPYGFNSLELLDALAHLFSGYGGHKAASGFSMPASNLPLLVEEIEHFFRNYRVGWEDIVDLTVEDPTPKLLEDLERLGSLGVEIWVLTRYRSDVFGDRFPHYQRPPEGARIVMTSGTGTLKLVEVLES